MSVVSGEWVSFRGNGCRFGGMGVVSGYERRFGGMGVVHGEWGSLPDIFWEWLKRGERADLRAVSGLRSQHSIGERGQVHRPTFARRSKLPLRGSARLL